MSITKNIRYIKSVEEHFYSFYKDVDAAHGLPHVRAVKKLALEMNSNLDLGLPFEEIVIASIGHDIFSFKHRTSHHTAAGDYIEIDESPIYDNIDDRTNIVNAIKEHRGSYTGSYSSPLSELISSADRGAPNLRNIIKRIHQCSNDPRLTMRNILAEAGTNIMFSDKAGDNLKDKSDALRITHGEIVYKTFIHLVEKYSIYGYARHPKIYTEYFKDELCDMYDEINKIIATPTLLEKYTS